MKKTILISPQADGEAWVTAATEALSNEFGVEPTADGRMCPFTGSEIGFKFFYSQGRVCLDITNAYNQQSSTSPINFVSSSVWALDVYRSANGTAIAVCLRISSSAALPEHVIAINSAGEYVGIRIYSTSIYFIRESESTSAKTSVAPTVYASKGCAFSLVRLPDIHRGAMFNEIYLILSAPVSITTGMIIHADNRDFVPICTANSALAIRV